MGPDNSLKNWGSESLHWPLPFRILVYFSVCRVSELPGVITWDALASCLRNGLLNQNLWESASLKSPRAGFYVHLSLRTTVLPAFYNASLYIDSNLNNQPLSLRVDCLSQILLVL